MTPPPPDASVRLHLKCPDAEDFVERFAPNVTRGGIFLPTRDARTVGATIRFEIALLDDTVVFAGEGVVTWAKPKGMGVRFTTLDPATEPMLERLLRAARAKARIRASAAALLQASEGPTPRHANPAPRATGRSPLSIEPRARRPLVRVAIVCSAVFVGVAVLWMSMVARASARARRPSPEAGDRRDRCARRRRARPRNRHAGAAVPASPAPPPEPRRPKRLPRRHRRRARPPLPRTARARAGFASRRCSPAPRTRTSPVLTPPPGSRRGPARP